MLNGLHRYQFAITQANKSEFLKLRREVAPALGQPGIAERCNIIIESA